MVLISIDPSNLVGILLARILHQSRTAVASKWDFWWGLLPWVLLQGLLVLVLGFRVIKTVHDSRAPSELLQRILAKEEETLDIATLVVAEAIVGCVCIQSLRGPSSQPGQRNPAAGDIELQNLGRRDNGPQPGHELIGLAGQDEEAWFGGRLDIEAGGELRPLEGVDDLVLHMPGAFPL